MIAIDTNILVHAHRAESEWHAPADRCLTQLAESGEDWAIPWPCVHEFLSTETHPRIFKVPSPPRVALDQVRAWMEAPSLTLLGETPAYWDVFEEVVGSAQATGPLVHDARVAALCLAHGVDELWTADRDFSRFGGLRVRNPLLG